MKAKDKQKEKAAKMKQLRKELEEKLEEQLPVEVDEKTRVEVQRIDENGELDPVQSKRVIEALLFAASKPMTVSEIKKAMKFLSPKDIQNFIEELKSEYSEQGRSFEIIEIAGGYEITTRKDFAAWIFKIELQKKAKQVTQSALETLAILAYRQPITRAEIEELRGVDASGVVNTLMERGLVKIVGKKEVPGRPFLYGTTDKFLEHFGLNAIKDLPSIEEIHKLVEESVRKEELLGKSNVVEVSQEPAEPETSNEQTEESSQENSEEQSEEDAASGVEDAPSEEMAEEK